MDADTHRALWITFLCRRFRTPPKEVHKHFLSGTREIKDVLGELLKQRQKKIPDALLGIGLWNLLPSYKAGALERSVYEKGFQKLYKRSVKEMEERWLDTETPVFPNDPPQSLLEPLLKQEENNNASIVRLEVLLAGTLDELGETVNPAVWKKLSPFWRITIPEPAEPPKTPTAQLCLPHEMTGNGFDVKVSFETSNGAFEARTDFMIEPNDHIDVCYGSLSIQKEAGRPGLTRVAVQRTVRFKPQFDHFRVPTALYWLHADLIFFVHETLLAQQEASLPDSPGGTPDARVISTVPPKRR